MSMSAIAPIAAAPHPGVNKAEDRKAFHQVRTDLKSGDVDSASQAFADMTRNVPAKVLNDPNTALGQLNQALQSGDVDAAQKALGSFAGNVQNYRAGTTAPVATTNPVTSQPVTSSTGGAAGTVLNAIA